MLTTSQISRLALTVDLLKCPVTLAGYQFGSENLTGEIMLAGGAACVSARDINFGGGRIDQRDMTKIGSQSAWQEAFIKPGVKMNFDLSPGVSILGGRSAIGASTWGDGDAGGYSRSFDGRIAPEALYLGIRADEWALTLGRQDYIAATGFIVMDGNFDMFKDGAYFSPAWMTRWDDIPVYAYCENGLDSIPESVAADRFTDQLQLNLR